MMNFQKDKCEKKSLQLNGFDCYKKKFHIWNCLILKRDFPYLWKILMALTHQSEAAWRLTPGRKPRNQFPFLLWPHILGTLPGTNNLVLEPHYPGIKYHFTFTLQTVRTRGDDGLKKICRTTFVEGVPIFFIHTKSPKYSSRFQLIIHTQHPHTLVTLVVSLLIIRTQK